MDAGSGEVNRREFLARAGAAGAVAMWVRPAEAAAAPGAVPRRRLGRHAEEVSAIALGGHTLADAPDKAEAMRIAHTAFDAGITFFDNAWGYHGGRAEEWMGEAIAGKRDRIFLMTKGCAGEKRRERGLRDLNESLRRLRTDRIDLWLVHSVRSADEVEAAHAADGVLSIVEEVKRAGKVRYVGFSGHADPRVHRLMLERGYPFDAVLMPLSAVDGSREDGFQRAVLPELVKRGIAPLGMKSLLGKAEPVAAGVFSAAEAIRYTMSLPITALVLGMSRLAQLEENLKVIRGFTPMGRVDALALETRCRAHTHFERYRA